MRFKSGEEITDGAERLWQQRSRGIMGGKKGRERESSCANCVEQGQLEWTAYRQPDLGYETPTHTQLTRGTHSHTHKYISHILSGAVALFPRSFSSFLPSVSPSSPSDSSIGAISVSFIRQVGDVVGRRGFDSPNLYLRRPVVFVMTASSSSSPLHPPPLLPPGSPRPKPN